MKKRTVKLPSMFDDEPASFTKWTPLREPFNGDDSVRDSAMHRARQSRARLADIEDEIDAVAQKSLAREKRLSNLKSLIANEDPFIDAADSFTSKSKKLSSSVKKVTF